MSQISPSYRPGICSVTFRHLSCEQIVALASEAGLAAIEWGTDVHLQPGNLSRVREVAALCSSAGLATHTLGSYLRCDDDENALIAVLDIADTLGADRVRVWAGESGSAEADNGYRSQVEKNLLKYCELATDRGLSIALEYHPNTLTDTVASTVALLKCIDHPALLTYWQPVPELPVKDALEELTQLQPWLCDLHVFHWVADKQRRPLKEGRLFWESVFNHLNKLEPRLDNKQHFAFLEFVAEDETGQCRLDARVLKSMCNQEQAGLY